MTRWHRIAHYPERWSNFDQIEECGKPKFCIGCEFKHPFCEENGVIIKPAPAVVLQERGTQ